MLTNLGKAGQYSVTARPCTGRVSSLYSIKNIARSIDRDFDGLLRPEPGIKINKKKTRNEAKYLFLRRISSIAQPPYMFI